jgi:cobalt-zinc-cadmium efflux system outer membrane protein
MSLPELEAFALAGNPRLKAMEAEALMAHKRIRPARALDDPRLKLGANSLPATDPNFRDSDMTTKEFGVSQMIPLGGKLSAREAIAEIEYRQARERLRGERIELVTMLRAASYELAFVRASIVIVNDIRAQIRLVIDGEIAASKSGMGSLTGVIKANLEYSMIEEELITLARKEVELRQRIRYLAGGDVEPATDGLLAPVFARPPGEGLEADLFESNPNLAILRLAHERASEIARLRQRDLVPDVELGLSYMQRDNGPMGKRDDMVSGMASFNLPLYYTSKNAPMIDEARLGRETAARLYDDRRNELLARARTLVDSLARWEAQYRLYTAQIIPQSSLALEAALARYLTGAVEFMPVVDTLRMLLRYRREALMALKEYHTAVAEIKALTGKEVAQ